MATGSGRPKRSLRRRLVVGITLAAAVAALIEALLLHVVWSGYEDRLIDRVVTDELRRSLEVYDREPGLAYPNTGDLRLYVTSTDPGAPGDPLPAHLRAMLDDPSARPGSDAPMAIVLRTVADDVGVEHHVGIAQRGPRTFMLLYDAAEHEERRKRMLWSLVGIVAILTLVAAWAAYTLSDRLLAGLSRLQHAVARGPGEGGFLRPDMDVEVGALAAALDDQRSQVLAALRKERAFAAAASHELRTPLTRIATGAEVVLAQGGLPDAAVRRLRSIRESVDDLQRLLDVLLQVARWQPGGTVTTGTEGAVPGRTLGAVVDACVAGLEAEARLLGTSIRTDVGSPARPVAQAAMLEVVLSNLLRNAIRHGRGSPVEVRERDGELEVIDAGPGIDPVALERVFDPFWQAEAEAAGDGGGPPGHGLGLTVAERICAVAGWALSIASEPGRGTRARVGLGGADPAAAAR
jgi:signal transduction histidine kinase